MKKYAGINLHIKGPLYSEGNGGQQPSIQISWHSKTGKIQAYPHAGTYKPETGRPVELWGAREAARVAVVGACGRRRFFLKTWIVDATKEIERLDKLDSKRVIARKYGSWGTRRRPGDIRPVLFTREEIRLARQVYLRRFGGTKEG